MNTEPLAYSVARAADALSISEDVLYTAIHSGDLPFRRNGRRYLIRTTDLLAWFESLPSEHVS